MNLNNIITHFILEFIIRIRKEWQKVAVLTVIIFHSVVKVEFSQFSKQFTMETSGK